MVAIYLQQGDPNLMQGLSMFGQGLGQYQNKMKQQNVLKNILQNIPEEPSRMDLIKSSIEAIKSGVPANDILQLKGLFPGTGLALNELNMDPISKALELAGVSDLEKETLLSEYQGAPTVGARTKAFEKIAETIERNSGLSGELSSQGIDNTGAQSLSNMQGEMQQGTGDQMQQNAGDQMQQEVSDQNTQAETQLRQRFINQSYSGKTAKERNRLKESNLKANEPFRSEVAEQSREAQTTLSTLKRMEEINKSGVLPNTLGEGLKVDSEGDVRFASVFDKDGRIQEYNKLVNGFLKKAKNYFGSQVTNFDLQSFKKMLPTLMNNNAGRERILKSMQIQTEIEKTLQDEIKNIYDEFGTQTYSRSQVEQLAETRAEEKLNKLRERFETEGVGGKVLMEIDGKQGLVPSDQVEAAIKQGYKKV